MNDLLFYALLIALIYYFFFYLPQKKLNANANLPLKHDKGLQTETIKETSSTDTLNCPGFQVNPQKIEALEKDIQQKEKTIIGLNKSYERLEESKKKEIQRITELLNKSETQITQLQTQIRDLAQRPAKPTNSKGTQTDDQELTQTLDTLIKNIQELNNEL